jgi:REP element-mobilizing transposase RayT
MKKTDEMAAEQFITNRRTGLCTSMSFGIWDWQHLENHLHGVSNKPKKQS